MCKTPNDIAYTIMLTCIGRGALSIFFMLYYQNKLLMQLQIVNIQILFGSSFLNLLWLLLSSRSLEK